MYFENKARCFSFTEIALEESCAYYQMEGLVDYTSSEEEVDGSDSNTTQPLPLLPPPPAAVHAQHAKRPVLLNSTAPSTHSLFVSAQLANLPPQSPLSPLHRSLSPLFPLASPVPPPLHVSLAYNCPPPAPFPPQLPPLPPLPRKISLQPTPIVLPARDKLCVALPLAEHSAAQLRQAFAPLAAALSVPQDAIPTTLHVSILYLEGLEDPTKLPPLPQLQHPIDVYLADPPIRVSRGRRVDCVGRLVPRN